MAGDFNKPVTGDAYTLWASTIRDMAADLARGLDPAVVSTTNIPTNAIRWNSAQSRDEIYNGSAWVVKSALYAINISGNAATATAAGAVPWSGISSKPTTISGYGITDMAAQTVDKASHLVGGAVGAMPYQTGSGATAMLTAGTSGYVLKANGAAAPAWVAQSALSVGVAASCTGNAATATTAAACSGNSATATTAAACSGNAATATTAAACSGNSATATSATSAGNADTVDGYHASAFAAAAHSHSDYIPKDLATGSYPVGMFLECTADGTLTAGSTYTSSAFTVLGTQRPAGTWRVIGPTTGAGGLTVVQRIA
ncbi:MAG TPA: hypothetical protein VFH22_13120 [Rhodocyclaceae bacterium]|nr:hypothetical protein [Rhodocyclaceae bacterium]